MLTSRAAGVLKCIQIIMASILLAIIVGGPVQSQNEWQFLQYGEYGKIEVYQNDQVYKAVFDNVYKFTKDGEPIDNTWYYDGDVFRNGNNYFSASVSLAGVVIQGGNNTMLAYSPDLIIDGKKLKPAKINLIKGNELIIDYGPVQRSLKTIGGRFIGTWAVTGDIKGDIDIRYNQTGNIKLALSPLAVSDDREYLPFEKYQDNKAVNLDLVKIGDSLEFNPDGHPETNTVDGITEQYGAAFWVDIRGAGGNDAYDNASYLYARLISYDATRWYVLDRGIMLFDASSIPDTANITSSYVSLYGHGKLDDLGDELSVIITSSAPASNTALVAGDYDSLGTTAFSGVLYYDFMVVDDWNDLTLNATGISAIPLDGITKFGLKFVADAINNEPDNTGVYGEKCQQVFRDAEYGDGSYAPKLVVTYTLPEITSFEVSSLGAINAYLEWTKSAPQDVTIRGSSDDYPATITDGELVYTGALLNYTYPCLAGTAKTFYFTAFIEDGNTKYASIGGDEMEVNLAIPGGVYSMIGGLLLLFINFFLKWKLVYLAVIPFMVGALVEPTFKDMWLQSGCVIVMFGCALAFYKAMSQGGESG